MTTTSDASSRPPRAPARAAYAALLRQDFTFFMSQLRAANGQPLIVARHHQAWGRLMMQHERLVILAPRGHGKTTTAVAFVLWQIYRHAHPVKVGRGTSAPGTFSVLLFSATREQAKAVLELVRELLVANEALFGVVGPRGTAAARRRGERWAEFGVHLASGADVRIRAYGRFSRGPHPNVVLLDDVESEENTSTLTKRDKAYQYFSGTLLPMQTDRILLLGTALHADDLLHRLGAPATAPPGFEWVKYCALDEATGEALWPEKHPAAKLLEFQAFDPLMFSREYQNDPRDDASSMFPRPLTDSLTVKGVPFLPSYRRTTEREVVVLGQDMALSEHVGADYTVQMVVVWSRETQKRRLIFARRARGLTFREQVDWLCEACERYHVDLAVVENNGFQKWLFQESQHHPETAGRVVGHRTGQEKADLDEGVPALKIVFQNGLWEVPIGDDESAAFFHVWQAEHAAMGRRDNRLVSAGEHDDTVLTTWFVERGIRLMEEWLRRVPRVEIVTAQDLGFEGVHISPELDAVDRLTGAESLFDAWRRRVKDDW